MGCDIHFVVEKRVKRWSEKLNDAVPTGRWIGVYSTFDTPEMMSGQDKMPPDIGGDQRWAIYKRVPLFKNRNYDFFAALAGVRGDGPEPRGFPSDASELAILMGDPDSSNWHSHSWDTMRGFVLTWLGVNYPDLCAQAVGEHISGNERRDVVEFVAGTFGDIEEYRVLYWFDN